MANLLARRWVDLAEVKIWRSRMDPIFVASFTEKPYPRGYGETQEKALADLKKTMHAQLLEEE